MTRLVNAMSLIQKFFVIMLLLVGVTKNVAAEIAPDETSLDRKAPASKSEDTEKPSLDITRKIQVLQFPQQLNFKFSGFQAHWITSQSDWDSLWKKSRVDMASPRLPINWKSESVLAIFWNSKDDVVRIPSFSNAEVIDLDGVTQMRLNFNLNTPCFGIITDSSPAELLLIDNTLVDVDRIVVHTDTTRTTNCF